jgi:S-adenosylmethionine decarboxylase
MIPSSQLAVAGTVSSGINQLTGFEGPEKILEVNFMPLSASPKGGARAISRADWDVMLEAAGCLILKTASNAYLDAYVLSESSLFVYAWKVVIKTCGTTTLLRLLPLLAQHAAAMRLTIEWVGYSRKNFMYPSEQASPHRSFVDEITYLSQYFDGEGHVLGPITSDHWLLYVSDNCDRPSSESTDRTLNIIMYDLGPEVSKLFYANGGNAAASALGDAGAAGEKVAWTGEDVTRATGIGNLLPGSTVSDHLFEPCGYSMNGLLEKAYWTIHVTPESHCSYASFETNIKIESYEELIVGVLSIFRPNRFTLTWFADEQGIGALDDDPCDHNLFRVPEVPMTPEAAATPPAAAPATPPAAAAPALFYHRAARSDTHFASDFSSTMCNYIRTGGEERSRRDLIHRAWKAASPTSVFVHAAESGTKTAAT